ncbi:hypothetical protein RHMOL_Rhmol13G0033300 [Rhododendron molle]|uniref:Uncharacterized protein n=1 Tax=Rhododendron molle TaxID=49168 RepID=A0ACC0L2Z5_RHOML|nr:hypothetical protein RHMOL_Rhmol13G0033300 [Rhododendron molle]
MLGSMNDGDISLSAYDTAWVALVEDIHGNGMEFIKGNMGKLEDANAEHMTIGFEVAFPSLIEMGRKLNIELPVDDSPILQEIYARRKLKLSRIPKDMLHTVPTALIYSLEGMPGLEWEKLLKLRCPNGSFLFSTSSTAFALMQTKDDKCFRYLNEIVEKFNGGVPHAYPIDLFERLWAVDRFERLGVSRYFQLKIKEYLDYVYRYWTEEGIFSTRCTTVQDIDDTSMGFRLLRRHGYQVSANVFRHFEKDGEFFCFAGQSTQGVTPMYNLYRASQVGYALDVPWYASLPRVETRFYLDQYGGADDVWIGKTLYRMPNVNNNKYLELAKLDYKNCQALHLQEWDAIQKHKETKLGQGLVPILLRTLNQLLVDGQLTRGDMHRREAELVVRSINLCADCRAPEQQLSQLSHPGHKRRDQ